MGMRSVLFRALVLACGTLLALPPGWCCLFGRGYCCGARPEAKAACSCAKTAEAACCCKEKPSEPLKPPPEKSRCCVRDLTVAPKVDPPTGGLAVAVLAGPPALLADLTTFSFSPTLPTTLSTPPLHLLYCVWLC
jgi:hypothetical protein